MNAPTWQSEQEPKPERPGVFGWILFVVRLLLIVPVLIVGLVLMLFLRLLEKPFGRRHPISPFVTQAVCRTALWIIGLRYRVQGRIMRRDGVVVANHSSWLDILVLNAGQRITFVSKAEVAAWPGIGWLARATGTLFIERDRRQAQAHVQNMHERLIAGEQLLFFPEGTSTDGRRVLTFKTTLFAAFQTPELRETLRIQPVTVAYRAPGGKDPRFYGWWGDMELGPHLIAMLGTWRHGAVCVTYHAPVRALDYRDRKALAKALELQVRGGEQSFNDAPDVDAKERQGQSNTR